MKFRKKPVVIEAIKWDGLNIQEVKDFVGDSLDCEIYYSAWEVGVTAPAADMKIKTLEGNMRVSIDDYIIKGIQGEFYPCKPDIFEQTYEPIT